VLDELLDWNQAAQFAIANSFYTTYLLTHVPAGIISDKFGGKYVLGFSILSASIIALLTPKSVQLSGGHYFVMILSRSCSGLALGMIFPSVNSLIANWAPARDRGKLSGFPFAGSQIGLALDQVVTNMLVIQSKTWSSPFYLYGSFGIVWFLVWHLVAASNPRFSRYITAQELDYFKREMGENLSRRDPISPVLF
jgi:ACS family sodium-dependent inorganic phosphate cotransporter